VSLHIADTKHANGQAFGPDGRLYAAATASAQILAYDSRTMPTVIAEGIRANDLVVRHDGGNCVTQPGGGGGNSSQVWYIKAQGEQRVVDTGLRFANGITLSPDQSLLYVADYASHWVYSYQQTSASAAPIFKRSSQPAASAFTSGNSKSAG
jgi:gluconolactonase